ncbi:hypothetical protein SUDANB95_04033 [Actinosynnema sp. ALI-1.44]
MVIARHGDSPGLVLTGIIELSDLDRLRAALLDAARPGHPEVVLDLIGVPFLRIAELRTIVTTAQELAHGGHRLLLHLAPHHEWAINAVGWAGAPGLVLANGDLPR